MKNEISEKLNSGMTSSKVQAWLVFEHDLSANEARKLVTEVKREEGIDTGTKLNMEALVRTIRELEGTTYSRKDKVAMIAEAAGSTVATANHMLSALRFAKEYARQEMEG